VSKTPKPLKIYVDPCLYPWPEMDALASQGHEVHSMSLPDFDEPDVAGYTIDESIRYLTHEYDIIFSPRAWYMTDAHKPYLPQAIKFARLVKYPRKK